MLEKIIQFTRRESTHTCKCYAHEYQLVSEWYRSLKLLTGIENCALSLHAYEEGFHKSGHKWP